ncbi:MAG: ZPR1 zinc finger domain-containing protein [Candidatus Nezhaarchaeota archaeon]|nr:ZPR1 zinc finger domain-containing protein [Candidatus Nezhaarchaeota archaeon]
MELPVSQRYRLPCPMCGVDLEVVDVYYDVPLFGKAVLTSMTCRGCGYRRSDVFSLEERPPCRHELKVEGPEDLSVRVVRSSTATITIPELGIEIRPGLLAEGFVSNVEGVLRRVEAILEQLLRDSEAPEDERVRRVLEEVRMAAEGRRAFSLVIEDPCGNSFIAPKEPRERGRA